MTQRPQRISRNGRITAYGLACGYTEGHQLAGLSVTLWHENGCYHVRVHDHRMQQRIAWVGFVHLGKARIEYDKWVAWADQFADSEERKGPQ